MQGGAQGPQHVVGVVDHVAGGELDHVLAVFLLERISAPGITLTITIRRVAQTTADLDDDVGVPKPEVDSGDMATVGLEHNLALGPWQACCPQT